MKICLGCGHLYADASWYCPSCGGNPPVVGGFPAFAPQYAHEGQGFRSEYFKTLANLEAGNFWFRSRNRLIMDSLRRHFPGLRDFLEVGCGTGYVLSGVSSAFPAARLTGTEIFCVGLDFASCRVPKAEFLQVDARRIPYSAEFDVVGAFDVLEHIPEDEAVISQMHQAIKPGGGVVVTVPQHDWLWSRQDELAGHVRRYSAEELRSKVTRAGFRVIEMRSFVSLLLPALWLSRLIGNGREADPLSELRLGVFVNTILGSVMKTEYVLERFGVSFPWGGSLLLIASKE